MVYNKIIIGAGLYGLYAAQQCGARGEKVLVLEKDSGPFRRATYINQARVHMGYHYPRSYSTAIKSAGYFTRFNEDYGFSISSKFEQIYATSANFSWTNAEEFRKFSAAAGIKCEDVAPTKYFNPGMCDGAFLTTEYTYDAILLRDHFLEKLAALPNVTIKYSESITGISQLNGSYRLTCESGLCAEAPFVLNATYAGVNEVLALAGFEPFKIKYELCEIILCTVEDSLKNIGITVMDGPFFSIMPFGKTGLHSLTSVTFTPHVTSFNPLPTFECQQKSCGLCTPESLYNCDDCPAKPASAWPFMGQLARKYLKQEYGFNFVNGLFSMKPILKASEIDDSRPTVVRTYTTGPTFVSVLSGKINTLYDLDEVLANA